MHSPGGSYDSVDDGSGSGGEAGRPGNLARGKALKDMGYAHVRNLGGFKAWVDSGQPTEGN